MPDHNYTFYYIGAGSTNTPVNIPETATHQTLVDGVAVTVVAATTTPSEQVLAGPLTRSVAVGNVFGANANLYEDAFPRPGNGSIKMPATTSLVAGNNLVVNLNLTNSVGTRAVGFGGNPDVNGGRPRRYPVFDNSGVSTATSSVRPTYEQPQDTEGNPIANEEDILRIVRDADNYIEIRTGDVAGTEVYADSRGPGTVTNSHGAQWGAGNTNTDVIRVRIWGTITANVGTIENGHSVQISRIRRTT